MPRIHITPVVLNLLIINGLVFLALALFPEKLLDYFVLHKPNVFGWYPEYTQAGKTYFLVEHNGTPFLGDEVGQFKPIQLVTVFFTHTAIWHIFLNMFALVSFGSMVETVMGAKRFLLSYLTIGVASSAIVAFLDPSSNAVLGASGALFGMMVLYAWYFPKSEIGIMFLPFRINARKFMIGAAILSAVLVVGGEFYEPVGFISHFGHLAGMVVGFLYLQIGGLRKIGRR